MRSGMFLLWNLPFSLTFDFDCLVIIKFRVADSLDFLNDFNAAISAYAYASAGGNDVLKAWIARISDRSRMFASGALRGVGDVVCRGK